MAKSDLPEAARVLPPAGQGVWLRAFHEAKDKGLPDDEASAFAWAAVKRAGYHKLGSGKWGKSMESNLTVNDDSFVLGVPFVKVNVQKRTVSGFATLDNIDQAGDVVDFSASKKAFAKWVGNIREMHSKVAVGKAMDITEKQYTNDDGKSYDGMWITAKISKGAEDTWQKVLDGTLCGFSIGGAVFEKEKQIVKSDDGDREVWVIKDYALNEVSLVDNPCNQLATVALVKSVDGALQFEDVIEDGEIEKGHVAHGDFVDLSASLNEVVSALEAYRDAAIAGKDDSSTIRAAEALKVFRCMAGCEMESADWNAKSKAASEAYSATKKDNDTDPDMEETMEKELQNNEISDTSSTEELSANDKSIIRKWFEKILGETPEIPAENVEETTEVEQVEKKGDIPDMNEEEVKGLLGETVAEVTKSVDGKFEEIGASLVKIAEALEAVVTAEKLEEVSKGLAEQVEALTERVAAVEEGGAVKKSADADAEQKIEKSEGLWADAIVPEFIRKNA